MAGQPERPRVAMEAALSSLTRDAEARHLSNATVAIDYVAYWNTYAWQHMLVYLHGARTVGDSSVVYKHIQFTPRFHYDWVDAVRINTPAALDRSFGGLDYIYLLGTFGVARIREDRQRQQRPRRQHTLHSELRG